MKCFHDYSLFINVNPLTFCIFSDLEGKGKYDVPFKITLIIIQKMLQFVLHNGSIVLSLIKNCV